MNKKVGKIKHEGTLDLNGLQIPCYVLEDGTRILSGRGMQNALKFTDTSSVDDAAKLSGVELTRFMGSKWFKSLVISEEKLEHFDPITCYKGNQPINGYEATALADLCDVLLEARKQGFLKTERQQTVADQCEILIRAFAKVGIVALVDEATGYQYTREKDELQKILKAYIAEELLPWQKKFPDSYYKEIFRLNKWDFTVNDIKKRPSVIGKWTNHIIYNQLPKGVLTELKEKTPKSEAGNYVARFHQSLTEDIDNTHLQNQINSVIAIMQISDNWKQFLTNFNKMVDRRNGQTELKFEDLEYKGEPKKIENTKFNKTLGAILKVPKPDK